MVKVKWRAPFFVEMKSGLALYDYIWCGSTQIPGPHSITYPHANEAIWMAYLWPTQLCLIKF